MCLGRHLARHCVLAWALLAGFAPCVAQTPEIATAPSAADPRWRALVEAFRTRLEPYYFDDADAAHRGIPDGELLVLQVRVGRLTLDAPITGIKQGRGVMAPVGELARALYLAIAVDPEAGRAEGWAFSEDNRVSLDVATRTLTAGDAAWTTTPDQITSDGLDIYVHTNVLSVWLGMEIAIDFRALVVEMTPDETLPIIAQYERRRRGGLDPRRRGLEPRHPPADAPYRLISTPFVDLQGTYAVRRSASGASRRTANYSLLASGDLAKMTGLVFVSGDAEQAARNGRISLSRTSPEGRLGGAAGATFVEVGDVRSVDLPFNGGGELQRGVRLTNRPFGGGVSFGTTDIDGDVSPGWDVELYRNDVLIGFQAVEADGRYVFADVPLFAGANEFRILAYGPRGEVREERRSVPVDPRVGGRFTYDLSFAEQGRSVFGLDPSANGDEVGVRVTAAAGVRVARRLTADLGLDTPIIGGEHRLQGVLGLSTALGPAVVSAAARRDLEKGLAARGDLSLPVITQQVRLSHEALFDFPQFGGEGETVDAATSTVAVSGPLPIPAGPRVSHEFAASLAQTEVGDLTAAEWRASTRLGRADLAAGVTWEEVLGRDQPDLFLADVSGAVSNVRFLGRARLTVDVNTEEVADLDLSLRYRASRAFSVSGRAQRVFATNADTLEARADWDAGPLTVGPRVIYSSEGPLSALIDARLSAGWDPAARSPRITSERLTSFGAVAARVFEDVDGDGRFSAGDQPIEGARVSVVAARRQALSDKKGAVYIDRLAPHRRTDVELDPASIEDPYLAPLRPGVSLAPRPGRVQTVDIALRATSEVEGVVRLRRRAGVAPLSGVIVRALDPDGREQGRTQTASDGFYVLSDLPAGLHRIVVDPVVLETNGWRPDASSFLMIRRTREVIVHDVSVAAPGAPPIEPAPGVFAPVDLARLRPAIAAPAPGPSAYGVWLGRYDSVFGRDAAALMLLGRFPRALADARLLDGRGGGAGGFALVLGPVDDAAAAEALCATLASVAPACRAVAADPQAFQTTPLEMQRAGGAIKVFE